MCCPAAVITEAGIDSRQSRLSTEIIFNFNVGGGVVAATAIAISSMVFVVTLLLIFAEISATPQSGACFVAFAAQ